jgi:succinate dehydrogenase / fumarate reductase cytochrome b subunit
MAITGLALCGFLIAHLGGNLLLYIGGAAYNQYAETLHSHEILLLVAEAGLLILFVGHIWLALVTSVENNSARPVGYAVRQSKQEEGPLVKPASEVMMVSGVVVLLFLLLHLVDFRFELRHQGEIEGVLPYVKAQVLLRDPLTAIVYVVGSVVLGYHVLHGFQSAFQTLGINHPKYTPTINLLSILFGIIVAAGFASFPVWAWAFR